MKRKLRRNGNSIVIALPSKLLSERGLEEGDLVDVDEVKLMQALTKSKESIVLKESESISNIIKDYEAFTRKMSDDV